MDRLPPELLQAIATWIYRPVHVHELVDVKLYNRCDALAEINRAWRAAVHRPVVPAPWSVVVECEAPRQLLRTWSRLRTSTKCMLNAKTRVGMLLRRLVVQWGLPMSFYSCDTDMLDPVGNYARVQLKIGLPSHERLVIVNDYTEPELRGRTRRTHIAATSAYSSYLMPVPQWVFKLPYGTHILHLEGALPTTNQLHLLREDAEVVEFDLLPEIVTDDE